MVHIGGYCQGNKVTLLGYSSKFVSLLKIFGFDGSELIRIKKGDGEILLNSLESIIDDSKSVKLVEHKNTLNNFRNINLSFAEALVSKGTIKNYQRKNIELE